MTETDLLLERAESLRGDPALAPLFDALATERGRLGFVGGIVRDWARGCAQSKDIDLVWDGPFDAIAAALRRHAMRARLRPDYLTATIHIGRLRVDVAATRRDTYPVPGGVPRIEPASLREDMRRRDFTANAIAVFPDSRDVVDLFDGLRDIHNGLLVPIHEKTLLEDPIRLLRGARYLGRFNWQPGGDWTDGLAAGSSPETWEHVARGRIWHEMERLSDEPDATAAWSWLRRLALDAALLGVTLTPQLLAALTAWRHDCRTLPRTGTGRRWLLDLYALESASPGVIEWIRSHWDTPEDQLRRYEKMARRLRNGHSPC